MALLGLPTVTLCAATSVNVAATVAAMDRCLAKARFADAVLFTDAQVAPNNPAIRVERIARLGSSEAYSRFMLAGLAGKISSDHCLVVQWDGFIIDSGAWDKAFLDCDYIGAPWPQFTDRLNVGNGGFSLRSRRLIEACADMQFSEGHPEDVLICRHKRAEFEAQGLRFASRELAERFAFERDRNALTSFGFHGAFNLIEAVGADAFWELYLGLDDPSTVYVDSVAIGSALRGGNRANWRRARLLVDHLWYSCGL
jgi:Protein of unknown function (DUF5672)